MLRCSSWCSNVRATWRVPNAPLPDCHQLLHFAVKTDVDCVENERFETMQIVTPPSALTPVCSVPTSLHTRIGAQTLARAASPVRICRTDTGLRACGRRWPALLEAPAKPGSRAWQTHQV